jgi:hypothetical protein
MVFLCSVRRLLVTANVVSSSPILANLMMEALSPSETSVLRRATQRNIPEDVILHLFKNFPEVGNRLIRHKCWSNAWSLPRLGKVVIFASFQDLEACDSRMQ